MAENYRPAPFFAALGDADGAPFFDVVEPAAFPKHILRYRNQRAATSVGLADLTDDDWIAHFGRFDPLPQNLQKPLALRYHGHQFRNYNPDIGDGRGFLFGQLFDGQGRLLDLGTKGSGKTPYSRFGDGRLTLKGGVREILATEMLEALGVYTSKTFSLIETGEALYRNDEPSPTRSSVMVRLSHSHVRFGAFQRLAFEEEDKAISELVDYCITRFYPSLLARTGEDRVVAFFENVVQRTAQLVGEWMAAGFVHGVLNTDNMNVTGESFDYGPWRFTPTADPGFTAAYFDETGLYAYGRQPEAAAWNLAQFGGALSRIADVGVLSERLQSFSKHYDNAMADAFFRRLGLKRSGDGDVSFVMAVLKWLTETAAPFEQFFFDWMCGAASVARRDASPAKAHYDDAGFATIKDRLLGFEPVAPERLEHPYFEQGAPCTMLIEEVEAIWAPIAENDDWSKFDAKLAEIGKMRAALGIGATRDSLKENA